MHWYTRSQLTCNVCGHVSRSVGEEARHRHNFPALCKVAPVICNGEMKNGKGCNRRTHDPSGRCWQHRG